MRLLDLIVLLLCSTAPRARAFLAPATPQRCWNLRATDPQNAKDVSENFRPSFVTTNEQKETILEASTVDIDEKSTGGDVSDSSAAATSTINDRLLAELEEATEKEKFGSRSKLTEKIRLDTFFPGSTKTDAEREAAIAQARDLNGINPLVTGVASVVALAAAAALWQGTTSLGVFLAMHPVDADSWYVVQRSSVVVRNVAVGLVSLAAGFCGVTGLGIGLLTVRVAVGVAKGELDPTPLPTPKDEEVKLPNVWNLMLGKKQKDLFGP